MEDVKIILTFIWVATMLIYLLGDVMRIFAGDFKPGEIDGKPVKPIMWLGIAIIMVIPIIMIILTLILSNPINKWINIIVAIFFLLFNLVGIKGYKAYDQFLLIVSFGFNILAIFYAWNWI
ncbi:MAG: DUF6326 family protein [Promethearchaeota archaeon]